MFSHCFSHYRGRTIPTCLTTLAVLFSFVSRSAADEREPLVRGQDRIGVPAIGEGLSLHNLFQSDMVLQRDRPIRVWGWAPPGETITVSFGGNEQSTTAGAGRRWSVSLPAMPANATPATMIVKRDTETHTLDNILVGDLWLLGGQSNMEHPISRTEDGDLEIVSAHHHGISILTIPSQNGPDTKSGFPRLDEWHPFFNTHYRKGYWEKCTPENIRELSGIGYVFARRLHLASRIPIGVIDVSRGGTSLETWLPLDLLRSSDTPGVRATLAEWDAKAAAFDPQNDLKTRIRRHQQRVDQLRKEGRDIPTGLAETPGDLAPGPTMDYNFPGNCYASMIAPIAGLPVKGAIWHQGYTNAAQPGGHVLYQQLFGKMIEAWRAAFDAPAMPFGIISLCTEGPEQTLENYTEMMVNEGPYIRQVQYLTFLEYEKAGDPNIGFASSYDFRRSWYHPQLKVPAGERIARWALATQYGIKIDWRPPIVTDLKTDAGCLILSFDIPVAGLSNNPIEGFAIAGKDRRFHPANADFQVLGQNAQGQPTLDDKTLVLTSPHVPDPIHFRYAWGRNPMGNLLPKFSQSRAPLATQRSDKWMIHEVPVPFADSPDQASLNLARQAGRLVDMDRRLKQAQGLLDKHQEIHTREFDAWNERWNSQKTPSPPTPDSRLLTPDS